eukprot:2471964-Alexandrium_andersonii.AAC.1
MCIRDRRVARRPRFAELQLEGSPNSDDTKPWTRTACHVGLLGPRPHTYGMPSSLRVWHVGRAEP